jgi:hypothetical protein
MLTLVGLLAVVVILINVAANPNNWRWLTGAPKPEPKPKVEQAQVRPPEKRAQTEEEDDDPLRPDAVRILPNHEPAAPAARAPAIPRDVPGDALALPRAVLATIRDDVVGVPLSETDAFYVILSKARSIPEGVLEKHALKGQAYTQLYSEPEQYRGQLVSLEGDVRRLVKKNASANTEGIDFYYEGWMFNNDSGNQPYVFFCTELPPGLAEIAPGEKTHEHIRVTGYYFKRYQYASAGGLNSAPMLLAHTVRWIPLKSTASKPIPPTRVPYILGGIALIGIVLGGAVWWFIAWDARTRARRLKAMKPVSPETVAALANVEALDPREELQRLAEADRTADEEED